MSVKDIYRQLENALLPWYEANKRDLPWRKDRDPYHIWLSEIMLQQTRVEAVKDYYRRFLDAVPTIEALSKTDDDVLRKLWEGLGYYSRVRNLKKAACRVMECHDGQFPSNYDDVLALPGIGDYTAGAVCSIAFGQKTPAVDGNVLRVIARLTDDATPVDLPAWKKQVRESLASVYPDDAGTFTQALMELGATICGPNRAPDCDVCPCKEMCLGRLHGTAGQLPVKLSKRGRKTQQMTVFILSCGDMYALEKRPDTGLLASLWQFPNVAGKMSTDAAVSFVEGKGVKIRDIMRAVERKHIFTHIEWDMRGVCFEVEAPGGEYTWMTRTQIQKEAAIPTAFRQFLEVTDHV